MNSMRTGRPPKPFWSYVKKTPQCWIWIGGHNRLYGAFRYNGRAQHSHRVSWQLHYGPVPDGLFVCHKCDNPPCVKPDHLFLGTASENNWDKAKKGRCKNGNRKGEKHPLSKYSNEQILEIRRLYKPYSHDFNQYTLAKMFGVSRASIGLIVTRKEWAHI